MLLALLGSRLLAGTTATAAVAGRCLQHLLSLQQQPQQQHRAAKSLQRQQLHQDQQHCHPHPQQQQQQLRAFSSSRAAADLSDFLDVATEPQSVATGRAWTAKELRNKSFDDMWKLWYVCLKERNMLLTQISWEAANERQLQQRSAMKSIYIQRIVHVKKTMNRIKQVLSERAHNEADAVKSAAMKRVIHYM